jgi:hypothetical protein
MRNTIYALLLMGLFSCSTFEQVTEVEEEEKEMPENFDYGNFEEGTYTNNYFKFSFDYDTSWVIQDKEQSKRLTDAGTNAIIDDIEGLEAALKAAEIKSAYLITMFKHEVGAPVESNPSLILVAENNEMFPGIKTGSDYLFHAKKLLNKTSLDYRFEKEPYSKQIGDTEFYVLEADLFMAGQTVHQHMISTISREFSLSFILSYTNDEEGEEVYEMFNSLKID